MPINYINVNQICSVKSYPNYICTRYVYKERKRFFPFVNQPEGFYEVDILSGDHLVLESEIKNNRHLIIRDKIVCYKPHLEIKMSNQCVHTMYFETEDEMHGFMESDPMVGVNWIKR